MSIADYGFAIWETFYVTVLSTAFSLSSACRWASCSWPGIRTAFCPCPAG